MRNALTWMTCLPPGAIPRPGLLPRALSWSLALMQQWVCVELTLLPGAQVSWSCVCERMRASLALSLMCHAVIWLREICLPPLAIWRWQKSWPQGHKNRKAGSALRQLQQSGERTLHLSWAQQ